MSFKVSTAKVDITPLPGVNPYMGGYGTQGGPRTVVSNDPHAQPLYARCAVIWDARMLRINKCCVPSLNGCPQPSIWRCAAGWSLRWSESLPAASSQSGNAAK